MPTPQVLTLMYEDSEGNPINLAEVILRRLKTISVMENKLVTVENNQIVVSETALKEMKKLQEFQITIQEMKNEEQEIRDALENAMDVAGVVKFENEFISVRRIPGSVKHTVDSKKLREEHPKIYKEVLKESVSKPYIKVTYKEGE